jgi:hypothetical protein
MGFFDFSKPYLLVQRLPLVHIAPVHFQDINFRGMMQFPVARYRSRLIPTTSSRMGRQHGVNRGFDG